MKRKVYSIFCLILAIILSLGITACKKDDKPIIPEYVKVTDLAKTALEKMGNSAYFSVEISVGPSTSLATTTAHVNLYFKKTDAGYDAYGNGTLYDKEIVVYLQNNTMVFGQKSALDSDYTYTKKTQVSIDDLLGEFGLKKTDLNDAIANVLSQLGSTVKYSEIGYHFLTSEDLASEVNDLLAALRIGKDMRFATILATYTAKTEAQLKTTFQNALNDTALFPEIIAELDTILTSAGLSTIKQQIDDLQSYLGLTTKQVLAFALPEYTAETYPASAYDVIAQEFASKTLNEILTSYGSTLNTEKIRDTVMNTLFPASNADAISLKEAIDFLANLMASKIDEYLSGTSVNSDLRAVLSEISTFIHAQDSVIDLVCSLSAATYSSSASFDINEVGYLTQYATTDLIALQRTVGTETSNYINIDTKTTFTFAYGQPTNVSFEIPAELL